MVVTEIFPNVWISDSSYSTDKIFLNKHNIKVVINCTKNLPFTSLDLKKYRMSVDDSLKPIDQTEMLSHLPELTNTMYLAYKTLTPMLVYCKVGIQRSATLIAAFLIRYTGIDYIAAIKIIQSKHELAFRPSVNFLNTLKKFSNMKLSVE
jgi:hypothetical protein